MPKLGPTGKFPLGKLTPEDEGELRLAVSSFNGAVRIDFGKPIAWFGLPPQQAIVFAQLIVKHARSLDPLAPNLPE
jgi:hypothetical protein